MKADTTELPVPEAKIQTPEIPEFTVRADSQFGIQCMIAIRNTASTLDLPREEQKALAVKLREFDLYEEIARKP